jgi:hypothetical protein
MDSPEDAFCAPILLESVMDEGNSQARRFWTQRMPPSSGPAVVLTLISDSLSLTEIKNS